MESARIFSLLQPRGCLLAHCWICLLSGETRFSGDVMMLPFLEPELRSGEDPQLGTLSTRSVLRVCPSKASKCPDGIPIWRSPSMSSAKNVDTSSPGLTIPWCSGPSSGYILLRISIASTSPRPLSDNLAPNASSIA